MLMHISFPNYDDAEYPFDSLVLDTAEHAEAAIMEVFNLHYPGQPFEGFIVVQIDGDLLNDNEIAQELSASFDNLASYLPTTCQIIEQFTQGALLAWLECFTTMPDSFERFQGHYRGTCISLDAFVEALMVETEGLNKDASYYQLINWDGSWDKLGFGQDFAEDKGHVFRR